MVTLPRFVRMLGAALAIGMGAAATSASAACDRILPAAAEAAPRPQRDITAADLLGLRDIGYPDAAQTGAPTPFGVSPDGRMVAFVVNRADVATNGYCRALVVLPTSGGPPRIVDRGGDFLQLRTSVRGLLAATGVAQVATPAWSPDGRQIAYLKRTDGRTRIWLVDVATASARTVSTPPVDVEDVAWANGGRTIVFRARPREAIVERDVDREGQALGLRLFAVNADFGGLGDDDKAAGRYGAVELLVASRRKIGRGGTVRCRNRKAMAALLRLFCATEAAIAPARRPARC